MMPAVLPRRISRPHRKIRRFGDGWQSGFAKSALPVSGRNEAIEIAEMLSVTPPFEDLGATHKSLKASRQKLLHLADGFGSAFSSLLPSIHPLDLLIGFAGAVIMWVVVYVKGKNAKKFRKNMEYGSARWGTPEDIEPYRVPVHRRRTL